jgi:hypothetical protein
MQQKGGVPLDVAQSLVRPGDFLYIPVNNTNVHEIPAQALSEIVSVAYPSNLPITTMNPAVGAGFYAHVWGPLPWAVGWPPPESFRACSSVGTIEFGPGPAVK